MILKYKRKEIVEAVQYTIYNMLYIAEFCNCFDVVIQASGNLLLRSRVDDCIYEVMPDDYIVKVSDVDFEIYSREVFHEKFEEQ
jgi:hypothetical protein